MKRYSVWVCVVLLAGCPVPGGKPASDDVGGPTGDTGSTAVADALSVSLSVACEDEDCATLIATAVVHEGELADTSWVWDGAAPVSGTEVQLPAVDGLGLLELTATGTDGSVVYTSGVVATSQVDVYAEGVVSPTSDPKSVFVPFADRCTDIPVMQIGGCIWGGADPIGVNIVAGAAVHDIGLSVSGALAGAPDAYTSTQPSPHAVWRLGPAPVQGVAGLTSPADYYTAAFPAPLAPGSHFTFYFDGVQPGVSELLFSHGPPGTTVFAQHLLQITCDGDGRVSNIARVPVDPETLDHDGDGYEAARDCDETDPTIHDGQGC